MRTGGSLAIVQETEKDDGLEREGVNLRALEGDLKWVNREEEEGGEGAEETEVLREATVLEAAITVSLFSVNIMCSPEYPNCSNVRFFIEIFKE